MSVQQTILSDAKVKILGGNQVNLGTNGYANGLSISSVRHIVRTTTGTLVMFRILSTDNKTIQYKTSVDNGGVWDVNWTTAKVPTNNSTRLSVTINPSTNNIYLLYGSGFDGYHKFVKGTYSAGTWTWGAEINVFAFSSWFGALCIRSDGNIWAIAHNQTGTLYSAYSTDEGSTWNANANKTSTSANQAMALIPVGTEVWAFCARYNSSPLKVYKWSTAWDAGTTILASGVGTESNYANESCLGVGKVSDSEIYAAVKTASGIRVFLYNGSSWDSGTLISSNASDESPAISIVNGKPFIAFRNYDGTYYQIAYTRWTGTAWTTPIALTSGTSTQNTPSVLETDTLHLHIGWQTGTSAPLTTYYEKVLIPNTIASNAVVIKRNIQNTLLSDAEITTSHLEAIWSRAVAIKRLIQNTILSNARGFISTTVSLGTTTNSVPTTEPAQRKIVKDSTGKLILFVNHDQGTTSGRIRYKTSSDNGVTWDSSWTAAYTTTDVTYFDVYIDTNDDILLAIRRTTDGFTLFQRLTYSSGSWSAGTPVVAYGANASHATITKRSNGDIWIGCTSGTPYLIGVYSTDGGGTWTTKTVSIGVTYDSLIFFPVGTDIWSFGKYGTQTQLYKYTTAWGSGSFMGSGLASGALTYGGVKQSDTAIWIAGATSSGIRVFKHNGTTMDSGTLVSSDANDTHPSMAIVYGQPMVVWRAYNQGRYDVVYSRFDGANWGIQTPISNSKSSTDTLPSILASNNDSLYTVWTTGTGSPYTINFNELAFNPTKTRTIASNAKIKKLALQSTVLSDAKIKVRIQQNILSDAKAKAIKQSNILSDTKIKYFAVQKTILSDAFITSQQRKPIYSDAKIFVTGKQSTIFSDAKVKVTHTGNNILSDAKAKKTGIQNTILSDAKIKKLALQSTVLSDAYCIYKIQQDILSDAVVLHRHQEDVPSNARIVLYHKEFYGNASIVKNSVKNLYCRTTVVQPTPLIPTGVIAQDRVKGDLVRIAWNPDSNYGYNVYRIGSRIKLNTYPIIGVYEYYVGSLTPDTEYEFFVVGVNGAGTESADSIHVFATPTWPIYSGQASRFQTYSYSVKINTIARTDIVLSTVELGYGTNPAIARFMIPADPSTASLPVIDDAVEVIVNNLSIFKGTIKNLEKSVSSSGMAVTYIAYSKALDYMQESVTWDYVLQYRKLYNLDLADQTYLQAQETIANFIGNYRIYYNMNTDVIEQYKLGTGFWNRTVTIGKNVIDWNVTYDTINQVKKITVRGDRPKTKIAWKDLTWLTRQVPNEYGILQTIRYIEIEAFNIGDIQVEALQSIGTAGHYFIDDAMAVVPSDFNLSSWADGTTDSKQPVRSSYNPSEEWRSAGTQVDYVYQRIGNEDIPVKAIITCNSFPTINRARITALSGGVRKGRIPAEDIQIYGTFIALDNWEYSSPFRLSYSYTEQLPSTSETGTVNPSRTVTDTQYKPFNDILNGEDDRTYVASQMADRATGELEKVNRPIISGRIQILGDETFNLKTLVEVEGEQLDVIRVTHNFGNGFTTDIELTNERFRINVPPYQEMRRTIEYQRRITGTEALLDSYRRQLQQLTDTRYVEQEKSGSIPKLPYSYYGD